MVDGARRQSGGQRGGLVYADGVRRVRRRRLVSLTAVLLGALLAGDNTAGATPARYLARSPEYVAIGDSFASGVGTRTYLADGTSCKRSLRAYPVLAAARAGATLVFEACTGASTSSVVANQLDQLDPTTAFVTVMVGGNDAGFASVITACAKPWWAASCGDRVDDAQEIISRSLPTRLDDVYRRVRAAAPRAAVTVVGYPRLFMGEDCNAGTWFSSGEQDDLNDTADLLNSVSRTRASAIGFTFVDPTAAFAGHTVCDDVEWINGLSNPISESYHPNRAGQLAYTDLVDDHLD